MTLKISGKGWVVIPAELRKKYKLQAGDKVEIVDYGGVLALIPVLNESVKDAAGKLKGKSSLTRALLAERKKERARER